MANAAVTVNFFTNVKIANQEGMMYLYASAKGKATSCQQASESEHAVAAAIAATVICKHKRSACETALQKYRMKYFM